VDGGTEIEIDVRGKPTNPPHILGEEGVTVGADMVLTLDKRIQESCESALAGQRGAVVVMDPFNGDILGMASSPGFNPNMFIQFVSADNWQRIANNPSYPMLNRAIQSVYPPGSTFKIVVATAALEEKKVDPQEVFDCRGSEKAGKRIYRCWKRDGHGLVNFARGMAESCDIYFYHLGTRLGPEAIEKYARLFGFGVPSGIDINGEKGGIIPGPAWKIRTKKERWFLGDTFNFSIGQGFVLATPLQMANAMSVLFNGGKLYKPRLVKWVLFRGGEKKKFDPQLIRQNSISSSTLDTMKAALRLVVKRGTGKPADISEAEVMGKTGTSQNPQGKDHAWFIAFAQPYTNSQAKPVVIAVFLENGGSGSGVACPAAAAVLRSIYQVRFSPAAPPDTGTISDTVFIGE
jgi:penicillin-binding protein 2